MLCALHSLGVWSGLARTTATALSGTGATVMVVREKRNCNCNCNCLLSVNVLQQGMSKRGQWPRQTIINNNMRMSEAAQSDLGKRSQVLKADQDQV